MHVKQMMYSFEVFSCFVYLDLTLRFKVYMKLTEWN